MTSQSEAASGVEFICLESACQRCHGELAAAPKVTCAYNNWSSNDLELLDSAEVLAGG